MLWKVIFTTAGVALFIAILGATDVQAVVRQTASIGWGALFIVALHTVSFLCDAIAWHITLRSVPPNGTWLYRIWKIRMVGEAFNLLIPAAGLGGEPLKAVLLRRHFGVEFRDGISSLILSQTIIVVGLVVFLFLGFLLMLSSDAFPYAYNLAAGIGLVALTVATALIIFLQHLQPSSMAFRLLRRFRVAASLESALQTLNEIETELVTFYRFHRARFFGAAVMAFLPWLIGVPEVYYAAIFLDHPISFRDAWVIEAAVQLVRAGAFFVPAGLGAQEGIFLLMVSAITGAPTLGVALAMVRRFREIVWIVWGMLIGLTFPATPKTAAGEAPDSDARGPGTGADT